jgi:pimeloyl-ACP methyl ester carboxylesterase
MTSGMSSPKALLPAAAAFFLALSCSSCVTKRAADLLTVPRRATDAEHWERETKLKPQRFEVQAKDGIMISAYSLEPAAGTKRVGTAWLLHGLGNSKEQMLPVARKLSAAGFRCVAWDSRGHGKTGGTRATFGTKEVDDTLRVMAEARHMKGTPRREPEVIWGYSMGTAVALQTLPHVSKVKAAVLLAPMSDLGGVMYHQARNHYSGTLQPLVPVVRAKVNSTAGFDPKNIRPVDCVKDTKCKLLLVHGDRDSTIPPWQSQQILDACKPGQGQRILLPGVGHGGVMWDLPEKTGSEAIEFLLQQSGAR